ncbi:sensor histidine kinase [Marinomonas sp. 15G1-11]|uniref:histidine kinase n=1 Tax=Marinomonas phaeophyticola TaxID=3004091 RepID=A0ABT4JRI6_9GAMM|nr:sensor histidine kinase [Marinomonas sp. 15G1-11]MCZ2720969.1 sensor histidine kinase [Marinomonas sp. 15G1-11]
MLNTPFFCWLIISFASLISSSLYATFDGQNSITPRFQFYVDQSGQQVFDDIIHLPEASFEHAPDAGYVGGYNRFVHWLRFTVPASDKAGETLILRTYPTYTDTITLHMPNSVPSLYTHMLNGEQVENRDIKTDKAFIFEFTSTTEPRTFYLSTQSTNTNTIVATLYNKYGYARALRIDYLLSGLFIGLLVTLIFLNLGYTRWSIDKVFRYYLLFVISSLLVFLAINRFLFLPSEWRTLESQLPQATTLFYMWSLALLYHALFEFNKHRLQRILSYTYQLLSFIGIITLVYGVYVEYMPWFMMSTIIYLIWITYIAFMQALKRYRDSGLLFFAVVFGFTGILGTALSLVGILSGGMVLLHSYTAGTLASILVLQRIMSSRIREFEKNHMALQLEKNHIQDLVTRERQEKEKKAQFISMLSHELKTPLSVIQMGLNQPTLSTIGHRHVIQAIKDMSVVIDRCSILEKVEDKVNTRFQIIEMVEFLNVLISQTQAKERINSYFNTSQHLIESDPDWLKVIINNLLDNALKYSPDQSMIDISTHSFSNRACIKITNITELGLPNTEKMYDKYYRGKSAHSKTGSGLGLYIVKQLSLQLNASIEYQATSNLDETNIHKVTMILCLPETK